MKREGTICLFINRSTRRLGVIVCFNAVKSVTRWILGVFRYECIVSSGGRSYQKEVVNPANGLIKSRHTAANEKNVPRGTSHWGKESEGLGNGITTLSNRFGHSITLPRERPSLP